MALIIARVPRKIAWSITDQLQLWLGTENAASLAASTPTGGRLAAQVPAWGEGDAHGGFGSEGFGEGGFGGGGTYGFGDGEFGYGEFGIHDAPRAVLEAQHQSVDKCATLPVGVIVVDACGNASVLFETIAQIHDPPIGARDLTVTPTENTLEALLTWTESPDV